MPSKNTKNDLSLQDLMASKNEMQPGLSGIENFLNNLGLDDQKGMDDDPRNVQQEPEENYPEENYEDILYKDEDEEDTEPVAPLKDIYADHPVVPDNVADGRPSWEEPRVVKQEPQYFERQEPVREEPAPTPQPRRNVYQQRPRTAAANSGENVVSVKYDERVSISLAISGSSVFTASQMRGAKTALKVAYGDSLRAECDMTSGNGVVKIGYTDGSVEIREDNAGRHAMQLINAADNTPVQIQADTESEITFMGRRIVVSPRQVDMYF